MEHTTVNRGVLGSSPSVSAIHTTTQVELETLNLVNYIGTWRSLVAHFIRGEGVVGSNPIVPT